MASWVPLTSSQEGSSLDGRKRCYPSLYPSYYYKVTVPWLQLMVVVQCTQPCQNQTPSHDSGSGDSYNQGSSFPENEDLKYTATSATETLYYMMKHADPQE